MRPRHFVSVVLAAVLWGTGGVLGAVLARTSDVPPASVAMWRMLIAGVALVAYLAARGDLRLGALTAPQARRIVATGALVGIFEVGYFSGIALAGVGLATLVTIGSAPVWVALWDGARLRVRPARRALVALALALGGLAVLLGTSLGTGDDAPAGVAVALATGAVFAGVTVVNRAPVAGLGSTRLTALAFAAGGVMLAPVALVGGWGMPAGVDGWAAALGLGVGATALAYVAYLDGLATVPPFVATVVSLLEPLVAAVLGVALLGESLGRWALAGAAALAAAVVLLRPQRDESVSRV
ncbi:DMT family transporter [Demequina pelophila]|uniref:DMT family transporter n=1 Tax=Demequina pelophila TaxID=1638984 RepID=UPI00078100EC|nr:EamA family transporter [Demequina pelophila]